MIDFKRPFKSQIEKYQKKKKKESEMWFSNRDFKNVEKEKQVWYFFFFKEKRYQWMQWLDK